jgi:hypothetical protein
MPQALFRLLLQHNNPPQHYDGSSGDINSSVALAQHDQQWWESDLEGVALSALIVPEITIQENESAITIIGGGDSVGTAKRSSGRAGDMYHIHLLPNAAALADAAALANK